MAPTLDKRFKEDLKLVCPELECRWEDKLERWVIYYNNPHVGKSYRIHEIKNPDGSYRAPDQRDTDMLRRCDMSTKVDSVSYLISKHYENVKREKAIARQKNREELRKKAQDKKGLWLAAANNASRGIFQNWQLGNKTVYSLPTMSLDSAKRNNLRLLKELGRPHLTGVATEITAKPQAQSLIIKPY